MAARGRNAAARGGPIAPLDLDEFPTVVIIGGDGTGAPTPATTAPFPVASTACENGCFQWRTLPTSPPSDPNPEAYGDPARVFVRTPRGSWSWRPPAT